MIRNATIKDVKEIAEIHVSSWRSTYIGQVPQNYLDELSVPDRERAWTEVIENRWGRLLVFDDDGQVIGFSSFGPSRDDDAGKEVGELYAVYILERYKHQGIGKALWQETQRALEKEQFEKITLWVLDTNMPARTFYEKCGFMQDGKTKSDHIGGQSVLELRYKRAIGVKSTE